MKRAQASRNGRVATLGIPAALVFSLISSLQPALADPARGTIGISLTIPARVAGGAVRLTDTPDGLVSAAFELCHNSPGGYRVQFAAGRDGALVSTRPALAGAALLGDDGELRPGETGALRATCSSNYAVRLPANGRALADPVTFVIMPQ